MLKKKVIGHSNEALLIVCVVTFLVSIITLAFLPSRDVLSFTVLGSGLGSVFFLTTNIILEYVLGWEW